MPIRFLPTRIGRGRSAGTRAGLRSMRVLAALGWVACAACAPRSESPRIGAATVIEGAVLRAPQASTSAAPASAAADTFHAGVRWDGTEREPDPSARAIAAYER